MKLNIKRNKKRLKESMNKLMLLEHINSNRIKLETKKRILVSKKKWKLMLYLIRFKIMHLFKEIKNNIKF